MGGGYYAVTGDLGAKFGASRFDMYGSRQVLVPPQTFTPPAQIVEDSARKRLIFAQPAGPVYANGFQLKTYDLTSGEVRVFLSRRGGSALALRSRGTGSGSRTSIGTTRKRSWSCTSWRPGRERILHRGLDRDRQESGAGHHVRRLSVDGLASSGTGAGRSSGADTCMR
jgi:hypothetical protein